MHRNKQPLSLSHTMSRLMARTPMLRVVPPFAVGIACADLLPAVGATPLLLLMAVAVVPMALAAFTRFRWSSLPFLASLWAFFIVFGILLANLHRTTPADGLPSGGWGTQGRAAAILQIRLDDSPHQSRRSYKVTAHVEGIWRGDEWQPASCPILLYFHKDSSAAALRYGDRLTIRTQPQLPDSSRNPHQFDYRRYLLRKGIAWQGYVSADAWQPLPDSLARRSELKAWSKRVQRELVGRLQATTLSPRHKGIAAALLLGWRDDLDDLTLLHFRQAGIAHLLCVSGLHVGIIAWMAGLLFLFMGRLRWQRVVKGSVQLLAVWTFAFITGLAPSTLRAAVTFSLLIIGNMLQERSLPLNDLCTSALLLLIINPNLLFDVGFQFSYSAVAGILLWKEPLSFPAVNPPEKWWTRLAYHIWKLIRLTLSAEAFTIPLQIFYFHQAYTWFLIANLLVVPFAGLFLGTTVAVLLLAALPVLGSAAVWLLQTELAIAEGLTAWVGTLPCAVFGNLYCDPPMLLLLYAALLLLTLFLHSRLQWALPAASGALLAAVVYLTAVNLRATKQHEIVVYDADKRMAIECFDGRHSYLVCDTATARNPDLIKFFREGAVLYHRTLSTTLLPADTTYSDGRCSLCGGVLRFGEDTVKLKSEN